MATTTTFMTADEYLLLPDSGRPTELVNGRVTTMNPPGFRHGQICNKIGRLLGNFVDGRQVGTVVSNDSGVITRRDPDTVRGADIAFYSYDTVPPESQPIGYPSGPPEIVFEVLSPNDQSSQTEMKILEYLQAGVTIVCVVDDRQRQIIVHRATPDIKIFNEADELNFPAVLPGFTVAVSKIFS